jgi:hypothetical protein
VPEEVGDGRERRFLRLRLVRGAGPEPLESLLHDLRHPFRCSLRNSKYSMSSHPGGRACQNRACSWSLGGSLAKNSGKYSAGLVSEMAMLSAHSTNAKLQIWFVRVVPVMPIDDR